ncbi:MAG: hypothetical protein D6761_04125 [Candidatus Dadabacteria bacterium]|nr:MAG: hypothetical protein D6761_04125 [Candidatus Dadabacteria bacterium]
MFLTVCVFFMDAVLTSILVGIAFFAVFPSHKPFSLRSLVATALVLFVFVNLPYPAIKSWGVVFRMENTAVAEFLGITGEVRLEDVLYGFGWIDVLDYAFRSLIANMAGKWLLSRKAEPICGQA